MIITAIAISEVKNWNIYATISTLNITAIAISQVTGLKYVLHNIHCEHYCDRYLSDYKAPRIIYAKYHQVGVAYAEKLCHDNTWGLKGKCFNSKLIFVLHWDTVQKDAVFTEVSNLLWKLPIRWEMLVTKATIGKCQIGFDFLPPTLSTTTTTSNHFGELFLDYLSIIKKIYTWK